MAAAPISGGERKSFIYRVKDYRGDEYRGGIYRVLDYRGDGYRGRKLALWKLLRGGRN